MNVVMLLYPRLTQLDFTGPYEVFTRVKEMRLHVVSREAGLVTDGGGLRLFAEHGYDDCPAADLLFVPGGPGQLDLMQDAATLDFLRRQAVGARYITSVCTGSLVLAAAGLLRGYRATSHWLSLSQLALMGAEPVGERVVIDRDRITGAGVTSGIDFALTLVAHLYGQERAERIQLSMEYDPQPPWNSGSPRAAPAALVQAVTEASAEFQARRVVAARAAGEALDAAPARTP